MHVWVSGTILAAATNLLFLVCLCDLLASIAFLVDNVGTLYINGDRIGTYNYGTAFPTFTVTLREGPNVIYVSGVNTDGPAGLLLTAIGPEGEILFHSDNTWTYTPPPSKSKAIDLDTHPSSKSRGFGAVCCLLSAVCCRHWSVCGVAFD